MMESISPLLGDRTDITICVVMFCYR